MMKKKIAVLKALRAVHGWNQAQVAGAVGLSTQRLSRLERGVFPIRANERAALARLFDVGVDVIRGGGQ